MNQYKITYMNQLLLIYNMTYSIHTDELDLQYIII